MPRDRLGGVESKVSTRGARLFSEGALVLAPGKLEEEEVWRGVMVAGGEVVLSSRAEDSSRCFLLSLLEEEELDGDPSSSAESLSSCFVVALRLLAALSGIEEYGGGS